MVCLSRRIQYRQQSEGSYMPDTDLQTSASNVILSEADVIPNEGSVIPNQASDILSEAKDLSPLETPPDDDTLDLELEEELVIEDFTIDGICGVY
jgi:mycofactocin precursor